MDKNTELVACISLLLAATLFITITILEQNQNAHTPFSLADDFEQFPKNEWVIETVESGRVSRSPEQKVSGLYSAHLYSQNTTDVAGAYLPISELKDLHVSIWFYVDYSIIPDHMYIVDLRGSDGVQSRIVVNDVNGTCNVCVLGVGNRYDPASYQVVSSIRGNVWHKLELEVSWLGNLKVLDVKLDDWDYGFYSLHDYSVMVDRLYLGDSTVGGFKGSIYIDDLSIEGPFY
ncbi:MAG: hypothetical protein NTY03_04425 [Candidatus Bathyarchaeota archaeon]|nr:hypothetical protein [Candidatus Bathyarchaeota archaeon]